MAKICMRIDPYYQQQKYGPVTLVSEDIRYVRIFANVLCGGGIKRQRDCRQRQFSAFSLAIFSETLELRTALLHSDTQSVVSFSLDVKMRDLE